MCTPTYFLMKYNPWKGFWMTINYKINHVIWNSFYWCIICCDDIMCGMAGIQVRILKFGIQVFLCSIYLIPTLNLRPGLNSAAFFTYIVKFSAFKLLSFMAYTYNIQGWWDGTRCRPLWRPPSLMTATPWQPHSLMSTLTLSTFNLININYDNLWLHILNVVEGLMWIGKNSLNNFIFHLSWLNKLPLLIQIPSYPFVNFWNPVNFFFFFELESLVKCWIWLV